MLQVSAWFYQSSCSRVDRSTGWRWPRSRKLLETCPLIAADGCNLLSPLCPLPYLFREMSTINWTQGVKYVSLETKENDNRGEVALCPLSSTLLILRPGPVSFLSLFLCASFFTLTLSSPLLSLPLCLCFCFSCVPELLFLLTTDWPDGRVAVH